MSNTGNAGKGRPLGSRNKSLVTRTEAIRNAITEAECKNLAREMLRMAFDVTISPADRIKAQALLLKYIAYTADVELIADSEASKPSADSMAKAAALIESLSKS